VAGSQAADSGLSGTYNNGGFCYQNPDGQENTYRLQVTEVDYDASADYADLSLLPQKWDSSSNQYRDDNAAFTISVAKMSLGGYYRDANVFCESFTSNNARHLGGDVYRYGVWTSSRTVNVSLPGSAPAPTP
jgi:hypothetical protein